VKLNAIEFMPAAPVRKSTGQMVRPLPDDEEDEEMPRTKSDSAPEAAGTPPATHKKRKYTRRAKAATAKARAPRDGTPAPARFGVFDDGSVSINVSTCTGTLSREEAGVLLGFIQHMNRE
jgi:hypothetical protein